MRSLKVIVLKIMLFVGFSSYGQELNILSIKKAYQLAKDNYPLTKQYDLIAKTEEFSLKNAAKGYFPMLSING